jgi:hypothetical protein
MAFIKLFRLIVSILISGLGIAMFFFDDVNLTMTFDKLLEALHILINEGPKCGYSYSL